MAVAGRVSYAVIAAGSDSMVQTSAVDYVQIAGDGGLRDLVRLILFGKPLNN